MSGESVNRSKHSRRAKQHGFTKPALTVFAVLVISAAIGFGGCVGSDMANVLELLKDFLFCVMGELGTLLAPLLTSVGVIVAMLIVLWKGIARL